MSEMPEDVMQLARKAIMAEVNPDVRWQYADGRCDHFAVVQAIARAIMAERERCAKIAKGEVYAHFYRTWPFWPVQKDGKRGNLSNDSEIVKHCDKIAAAILDPRTADGE